VIFVKQKDVGIIYCYAPMLTVFWFENFLTMV